MQNICEIAWVNNKTLGYENWLPQHAQNIIAVKNFCSKMKNFNILTQKWNKLMKITLSAQFYEKGFKSNTPTQCNSRSLSHPPSPTLVDNESNRKSFWNWCASKKKLLKYLHINFQIWFPKYNFKNPKYIKNIEVCSLRTPALALSHYE